MCTDRRQYDASSASEERLKADLTRCWDHPEAPLLPRALPRTFQTMVRDSPGRAERARKIQEPTMLAQAALDGLVGHRLRDMGTCARKSHLFIILTFFQFGWS